MDSYESGSISIDAGREPALRQSSTESLPRPVTEVFQQSDTSADVDPQIIEALRSKDRLYVLKLGEQFEGLIHEPERRSPRVELTPVTSYQRMLVHRCSAFYKVKPDNDPTTKSISVTLTTESRIPNRRLSELVPVEETSQPAFKIMQRSALGGRARPRSHAGSVAGDDGDLSDVEPSEAGSLGGRSYASRQKFKTIEEREVAYNAARSRIFMDFEDKEKEKDSSTSSSSMSMSGSTSAGDFDDMLSVSSPATESEWSGPGGRERKDLRRNGTTSSSSSWSTSSWARSPGSTGSRNSRAPSPSYSYPSLYDPSTGTTNAPFDPSQLPPHPVNGGYGQIFYHYPTYPPPNQPYMGPQFYPQYPYPPGSQAPQPMPPQTLPDQPLPVGAEIYHPQQHMPYGNPYMWSPPPPPQQVSHQHPPSVAPGAAMGPPSVSPPFHPQFPPPPPPGYGYPMPPYVYPQQMAPPPMPAQQQAAYEYALNNPSPPLPPINRNGSNHSHASRSSSSSRSSGTGKRRLWNGNHNDSSVGPRMNTMRKTSNEKGAYNPKSSPTNDDVSSVASSSTTSSSSRRTYTSNTSSQHHHPLPARPDWAVGLKAQPTLYSSRHDNPNAMPNITPRNGSTSSPDSPPRPHPSSFQSTDFPPLSTNSSVSSEKRPPAGVWTNARSILQPSNGAPCSPQQPSSATDAPIIEQQDAEFERPAPKTPPELFNPKATKKSASSAGGRIDKNGGLADATAHLAAVTLDEGGSPSEPGV